MPAPIPYKRSFSFTNAQADSPADPLPGHRVDIELDAIAQASAELTDRVNAGLDVDINQEQLEIISDNIATIVFAAENMDAIRDSEDHAASAAASVGAAAAEANAAQNAAAEADAARDVTVATAQYTYPDMSTLLTETDTIAVGTVVMTRAEGYSYIVAPPAATDHHLTGSPSGQKFYVHPGNSHLEPEMFGSFGGPWEGSLPFDPADLTKIDTTNVPDETVQWQAMLDFAVRYGKPVVTATADRVYGWSSTVVARPTVGRNRASDGSHGEQHFSNQATLHWSNPGNCAIVALGPMQEMLLLDNPLGVDASPPCHCEFRGVLFVGNWDALNGIRTDWSYRNSYDHVRMHSMVDYGWVLVYDAGSGWDMCEAKCGQGAIYAPNAGDWTWTRGDVWVGTNGFVLGGGSNTEINRVTFTGVNNGDMATVRKAISYFNPDTVFPDTRSRSIKVTGCESVGIDYLVYGEDADADGTREIWNVNIEKNHIVRNAVRPNAKLCYLRNANSVYLAGNNHGDFENIGGTATEASVEIEDCHSLTIMDHFNKIQRRAIHLIGCAGGRIASNFINCGTVGSDPIVTLENSTDISIVGSACHWRTGVTPAGGVTFVSETGTSYRNVVKNNAVNTSKMVRPYTRVGAQSRMEHEYYGDYSYAGATIGGDSGDAFLVPVSGARLGDAGEVIFGTDLRGLQADVQIMGTNSARVTMRNGTGASQTIPACTVTVIARSR